MTEYDWPLFLAVGSHVGYGHGVDLLHEAQLAAVPCQVECPNPMGHDDGWWFVEEAMPCGWCRAVV